MLLVCSEVIVVSVMVLVFGCFFCSSGCIVVRV